MRAWIVIALVIAGCKKEAPPRIDRETLWALVPDNAVAGIVITPAALERVESGYTMIRELARLPEMTELEAQITPLEKWLRKPMSFAALGLSTREAAAVFFVDDREPIFVVPLADRNRFVSISKGKSDGDVDTIENGFTCTTVKDIYACAQTPALIARLGKGRPPEIVAMVGVPGDIEGFIAMPGGPAVGAVVQLSRGGFTLHAASKEIPAPLKLMFANAKPRIEPTTAGFAMINFGRAIAALGDQVPPVPIVKGVTLDVLVKSLAGPLTMTIENGASTFDLRVPLNENAPAQQLVGQCDSIEALAAFGAVVKDGVCDMSNEQLNARLDGWVEDSTLRFADRAAASPGVRTAMSRAAQQLANEPWTFAVVGRGTMFAPTTVKIPPESFPPDDRGSLRVLTTFTEIGVGVRLDGDVVRGVVTTRTIWENPDDIVAKLTAIEVGDIVTGKAAATAKAIADAAPQSPFAADYKAGMFSLFVPIAVMAGLQEAVTGAVREYVKW